MKTTRFLTQKLLFAIIMLFAFTAASSQGPGMGRNPRKKMEKIKTYKIAFITEKLNLTPEEAEKFWPVYNSHMKEMEQLQKTRFDNIPNAPKDMEDLTKEEAEAAVDEILDNEKNILDLKIEFKNKLKPILSAKKILRLFDAEREFRMELMKRLSGNGISERPERPKRQERTERTEGRSQ
jgi:Spy/CpxP family protein refolding chaperone